MRKRTLLLVVLACAAIGFAALAAPPFITQVEKTDDKTVLVYFDKSVQNYSTVELGDWAFAGSVNPTASNWVAGTQLELTFAAAVTLPLDLTYDRLQAADNSIQDVGGLPLYTVTEAVTDTTPPSIVSAVQTATDKVTVTFDEATDVLVSNLAWLLFEDPTIAGTAIFTDADIVVISFNKDIATGQTLFYDVSESASPGLEDLIGNALPDQYVTITDGLAPEIDTVEKTGAKTVLVTFDELITGSFEAVDWVIATNTALSAVFGTNVAGTVSTLAITYSSDIAGTINYYQNRGTADSIVDLAANPLADSTANAVADVTLPTISSAKMTADNVVTVTFSEDIAATTIVWTDWWITEDPTNVVTVSVPAAGALGAATRTLVLTFTAAKNVAVGQHVRYVPGDLADATGNDLANQSVEITDGIAPEIDTVEKTGAKTVLVTFDELITGSFEAVDWVIATNTALSAVFGTNVAGTVSTLAITYSSDIAGTINYYQNRGTADSIVDLAANPLADSTANAVADVTLPTISSAKMTADNVVTVTFSEDIAATTIVVWTDWWITEDPTNVVTVSVPAAGALVAATRTLVLTFTAAKNVAVGQHVRYVPGDLADATGNDLANQSVEITDGNAPEIASVQITGDKTARVTFSEVVVGAYESLDWRLKDTLTHPIGGVPADIAATVGVPAHSVLDLTFNVSLVLTKNLSYTAAGGAVPDSVKDANGNAMIDADVAMTANAATALDVAGVVKSGDSEVIVTFTKDVAPTSALELVDWTLVNLPTQPAAIDGAFIADGLLWLRFPVDVAVGYTLKYDSTDKDAAGPDTANSVKDAGAVALATGIYPIVANTATVTVNDVTLPAGSSGTVTVSVDMDGAGLGGMQVGPTGAFTFDPAVVNVTGISAASPYAVLASDINNTTGAATFALTITGAAGDAIIDGVVVSIHVDVLAGVSGTSALELSADWVKDVNDGGVNATIVDGTLTIGAAPVSTADGDVNGDGSIDITDARWAAEYAIGIRTLTVAQIAAADVAPPAGVDITDARWIAEAAIGIRTLSLVKAVMPSGLMSEAYVSINDYDELVIGETNAAVTDIQGTIYFDPDDVTVTSMEAVNGFQILGQYINNDAGYVRFAVAQLSGSSFAGGTVIEFNTRRGDLADAVIVLDVLRNEAGSNVPYQAMSVDEPQILEFGCSPSVVDDVHTTYFGVKATSPVEEIRVYIYNFSGDLVYDSGWGPNDLAWHVDNDAGDTLSNGVYYYRMEVKLAGADEPVVTGVGKVAVYR